ncbi:MAG: radical SAM protein [Thermodesulfobacteriaceae bacterium]|nr:radical SAM protein [Thermodesulfobacteriaceae bacterium]MCX8041658.1 radical SAM protein [Thermodesulfobacteriaceae bacterium]MDW8135310.1 4Fe-4S single cluster domain-containing protein [Thermodesulfobacterium sp.]
MLEERVYLNIGAIQERSIANGPGERFVLWLQGCLLNCPGCINPEFQPLVKRVILSVEEVFERITKVKGIEGVTFTGGEPMLQAKALALLSEKLKKTGLTLMCYTGYTLEELKTFNNYWIEKLLSNLDILIDGPFILEKKASLPWRGSSNQRVYFLTPTYQHLQKFVESPLREIEFIVDSKGFLVTGVSFEELLLKLRETLKR